MRARNDAQRAIIARAWSHSLTAECAGFPATDRSLVRALLLGMLRKAEDVSNLSRGARRRSRARAASASARVFQRPLDFGRIRMRFAAVRFHDGATDFERLHALAEIVERGAVVLVERPRVKPPHREREFIIPRRAATTRERSWLRRFLAESGARLPRIERDCPAPRASFVFQWRACVRFIPKSPASFVSSPSWLRAGSMPGGDHVCALGRFEDAYRTARLYSEEAIEIARTANNYARRLWKRHTEAGEAHRSAKDQPRSDEVSYANALY